jgi:hypothetical protein
MKARMEAKCDLHRLNIRCSECHRAAWTPSGESIASWEGWREGGGASRVRLPL